MTQKTRVALSIVVLLLAGPLSFVAPAEAQTSGGRPGTGRELLDDCRRYFSFLGRTGAGREETFNEDPFGMGYCAGIVRGVANAADAFHPQLECRLHSYTFHHLVRSVVRYLEMRPQTLDEPDTVLVLRALQLEGVCGVPVPSR